MRDRIMLHMNKGEDWKLAWKPWIMMSVILRT